MKKRLLLFLMFPLLCTAVEYEFLTPQVIVIKSSGLPNLSTVGNNIISSGVWFKENALLRDKKGNILKKADVSCFTYLVLGKPLKPGEKRNFNVCTG